MHVYIVIPLLLQLSLSVATTTTIEPELIDGAVVDAAEYSEALATLASSATLSESCMELVSEALSLSFAEIITLITASSDTHLHYIAHCVTAAEVEE